MCVLGLSSREVKLFLAVCMSVPLKVISNCSEGNRVEDIAFSSSWVAQRQVYVEDGPLGHCCRLHTPLSLSVSSLSLSSHSLSPPSLSIGDFQYHLSAFQKYSSYGGWQMLPNILLDQACLL